MNKYLKFLAGAMLVTTFSSCLKDKEFEDNGYGLTNLESNKIIELSVGISAVHDKSIAIDFVDADVVRTFVTVRLAAKTPATEDIVVTLDTIGAQAQIDKYNIDNDKNLEKLPNSFYTYVGTGLKVTIPKGAIEANVDLTINAIDFDPSTTYALAFHIASVDKPGYTISGNFGKFLTTIGAKNKYDGVYTMTGVHNRPPYDADPYVDGWDMHMITVGAASVIYFWNDAGVYGHPINNAGGWYGGTFLPILDFDPVTDKLISVSQGSPGGVPYTVGPSTTSRYDPATKTIYAQFYYNGNLLRGFSDTLKYVGPRP